MYLLTAAIKKNNKSYGQNKLTAYSIPAHHLTQTNLLKSKQFRLALKQTNLTCLTHFKPYIELRNNKLAVRHTSENLSK